MTSTLPPAPDPTATRRTVLAVTGMTCGHCVGHVREALAALPGVSAEVDLDAGRATVSHPASVPVEDLLAAVDEAGYTAAPGR